MTYKLGMFLNGTNKAIGNIWIVTEVTALFLPKIALVWDGYNKLFCNDFKTSKHEYIKAGSVLDEATLAYVENVTSTTFTHFPQWVQDVRKQHGMVASAVTLPIGVLKSVNEALGITDDDLKDDKTVRIKYSGCRKSSNGDHNYKTYHGFTEFYEFCEHCDEKRPLPESC